MQKIITQNLAIREGLIKTKKFHKFNAKSNLENSNGKIITNSVIKLESTNKIYKPDIILISKKKRKGKIIEIGITNPDIISKVEITKRNKYIPVSREMSNKEKMSFSNIPIVVTWNGLITKFNKAYCNQIELDDFTLSYLQKCILHETLKIIMQNFNKKSEYLYEEMELESDLEINISRLETDIKYESED